VNALVDGGFQIAVIGNLRGDELKIVDFDCSQVIDLVDRLPLAELVALVSQARVLVANDSPPVQIAGAFDGWIGLVAAGRHPDYVLPWRHGAQTYRAKNLSRGALWDDYLHKPSGSVKPALDHCDPARQRECLPDPQAVVEFVKRAFAEGAN
jgi:ADP-heptose:LPS heptosyltransferase